MKKLITLLLILVICLTLCACGTKSISLTLDNYTDYLEVSGSYNMGGSPRKDKQHGTLYPEIETNIDVEGVSSNYIYNDVEIVVKISGTYTEFPNPTEYYRGTETDFEKNFTIKCNKAGNGSEHSSTKVSDYTGKIYTDLSFDIISVSGSIKEAN